MKKYILNEIENLKKKISTSNIIFSILVKFALKV